MCLSVFPLKILKKGGGIESRPVPSSTVVIRTRGSLEDGQSVDVNDHLKFTLGEGEVTHGRRCLLCVQ